MSAAVRIVSSLLFGLAAFWFGESRSNEALFTAGAFLLTYLGAEGVSARRRRQYEGPDRELFRAFLADLPFEGPIAFLREHDLRVPFELARFDPLYRYTNKWLDAAHEFHDKAIESARVGFHRTAVDFLDDLGMSTFPMRPHGTLQEIPQEWTETQPERHKEVSERLNRKADDVVAAYEKFVALARKRLQL
jgi:hypothetical protein